jgi:hypothetical protein
MKIKKGIENKQEKNNEITTESIIDNLHEERLKLEEELLEIELLLKNGDVYEDYESKTIKTNYKTLNTINQQKNGMQIKNIYELIYEHIHRCIRHHHIIIIIILPISII